MTRRLILAAALASGLVAGLAPIASADEYQLCVRTSDEESGHGGDSVCVNLPNPSSIITIGT